MRHSLVTLAAALAFAATAWPLAAGAQTGNSIHVRRAAPGVEHQYLRQAPSRDSSGYRAFGSTGAGPYGSYNGPYFSGLPHSPGTPENRGGGVDHW